MIRSSAVRDAWHPVTREDREAVLQEMERILSSPPFCNSKRYPALLRYIVVKTLDGRSDILKERTLGVDVFERPPSYDTNSDTVVRYTAGEVRKRLVLYYHEHGRGSAIQISLPAGSYVPEFHREEDSVSLELRPEEQSFQPEARLAVLSEPHSNGDAVVAGASPPPPADVGGPAHRPLRWWVAGVMVLALAVLSGTGWRYAKTRPKSPTQEFWAPLLSGRQTVLVCTGGSVFKEGNFSGVVTAGRDIEYPFVSSQVASSIARLSVLLERSGTSTDLQFSASTPITALREQPVILLGGYNNQWTLRLLERLPFRFTPEPSPSIAASDDPALRWARDQALPYSSADDYALVARFHDGTTDSWIVVIAGLGRNGTEAAAQFVTSEHYMQILRQQAGAGFADRNIEAVLKVNVIEGKTGAPSLLAVRTW